MNSRTLFVGGASGMTKAAARLLLEEGNAVVLLGRQHARLETARRELAPIGCVESYPLTSPTWSP